MTLRTYIIGGSVAVAVVLLYIYAIDPWLNPTPVIPTPPLFGNRWRAVSNQTHDPTPEYTFSVPLTGSDDVQMQYFEDDPWNYKVLKNTEKEVIIKEVLHPDTVGFREPNTLTYTAKNGKWVNEDKDKLWTLTLVPKK
jgi:hypothetical protein